MKLFEQIAELKLLLEKASDKTLSLPKKIESGKAYAMAAIVNLPALIARVRELEGALRVLVERDMTYYDDSVRMWFSTNAETHAAIRNARKALADKEV